MTTETRYAIEGQLLRPSGMGPGALLVEGATIVYVGETLPEAAGSVRRYKAHIVAPGFIDLQCNGAFGVEVGERPEAIRHLAARLPSTGVTTFLPTAITSTREHYRDLYTAFEAARRAPGATVLGLHLEGPFLSAERSGAHPRHVIEQADPDLLDQLLEGDALCMMTVAPERPGALGWIRRLRERGAVVALGHTNATFEELEQGVEAGATLVTHLYNAMSPFTHRAPGAVGAALVDDRITVGLIVDGVHSHPAAVQLALRAKGAERIVLVTDAMAAAGMGPGRYRLGGQEVIVDESSARLSDGTLAGSILTLDQAVRNLVAKAGVPVERALRMASEIPARLLSLGRKGDLRVGSDADLVLLDKDLHVEATTVAGKFVHRRAE